MVVINVGNKVQVITILVANILRRLLPAAFHIPFVSLARREELSDFPRVGAFRVPLLRHQCLRIVLEDVPELQV